ncbi:MAG: CBS domain-containing protein [bacterium]|nr:CBS domain-containing protein [bacterium]
MPKVSDILAAKGREVLQVDPDDTVLSAIASMVERGVGSVLVTRGKEIHGIFTERDYLAKIALQGRSSRDTKVRDVMSFELICVGEHHDVADVMAIMTEARIRHLPVVDRGGLAGLVSIGDCVRQISQDHEARIEYLTDYIHDKYPR